MLQSCGGRRKRRRGGANGTVCLGVNIISYMQAWRNIVSMEKGRGNTRDETDGGTDGTTPYPFHRYCLLALSAACSWRLLAACAPGTYALCTVQACISRCARDISSMARPGMAWHMGKRPSSSPPRLQDMMTRPHRPGLAVVQCCIRSRRRRTRRGKRRKRRQRGGIE